MKKLANQSGAMVLEVLLLLAVLGIAAFVLIHANSVKPASTPAKSPTASNTADQDDATLQAADQEASKDNLDVPTTDEAQLDSALATF